MEKIKTDILIVGGGPAGTVAAITARKNNKNKKIVLIREKEKGIIPCAIPYIFNRLDSVEKILMPDKLFKTNKIDLLIDKAINLKPAEKKLFLESGKELSYEKLILATGSKPTLIKIKGIDKKGVWTIKKDFEYLKKFRKEVLKSKNIVIIGGGFIGVELAEELSRIKKLNINIVEKLNHCLITTFDEEFVIPIEKKLKEKGIKIYTNTTVEEIIGKDKVEGVKLKTKKSFEIPADIVILSIGAKPNVDLAKKAGIKLGKYGGIKVDKYMETNVKDIFAVGDCAETRDLITKEFIPVMLASTACHEARIAAANLYKKENLLKNDGTLSIFSTFVNGLAIGIAGLNERRCKEKGYNIVVGISESPNHHPRALKNTQDIKVKLIFSKNSGKLLGGQIIGPEDVGEMINILGLSIQKKANIYNLDTLQISTHPLLTPAPTVYPIIVAAQNALIGFENNKKSKK
ncbi:MAG: pyridine nucleotide-disulfide oxidoreductase [Candidatus Aenigmatarchaeota archaeon]|nr:MAG: pyridine nucleotide-disulfide oxidoreductase [Candidatus Aenigmarchaeota archaeon]